MAETKIVRQDALEKLATLQKGYIDSKITGVTLTGKDAIEVDERVVKLNLDTANNILTQSSKGLLASLKLKYAEKQGTTPAQIQLLDSTDTVVSWIDASAFVMDGMLDDVKLEGNNLIFTFNTAAGSKTIDPVDLSKYIDTYTAGDGVAINGRAVSVNLKDGEQFLEVTSAGLATKGIQDAIDDAVDELTASDIKATAVGEGSATNVQGILGELNTAINSVKGKVISVKGGDGIKVTGAESEKTIAIQLASESEEFLQVTEAGLASKGIKEAIAKKINEAVGESLEYMSEKDAQDLYESIYE